MFLTYILSEYLKNGGSFNAGTYAINVGSIAKPCIYPADQLRIIDWQVVRGTLDDNQEMIEHAAKRPQKSKNLILDPRTEYGPLEILGLTHTASGQQKRFFEVLALLRR